MTNILDLSAIMALGKLYFAYRKLPRWVKFHCKINSTTQRGI